MSNPDEHGEADALQHCLVRLQAGETVDAILADIAYDPDRLRPLLQLVVDLQHWTPGTLSADARMALRARAQAALMQRATHRAPSALFSRWSRPQRRIALVACCLLIVCGMGLTPAVVAAESSLPGDRLYGLKRQTEQLQLVLTFSEADKASLYLDLASRRIAEIDGLASRHSAIDPGLATEIAQDYAAGRRLIGRLPGPQHVSLLARYSSEIQGHAQHLASVTDLDPQGTSPLAAVREQVAAALPASFIAASTFDADIDGWQTTYQDDQLDPPQPIYSMDGGDPGGAIFSTDNEHGPQWYWRAPRRFLGNVIATYGTTLMFELRESNDDRPTNVPDIVLVGDGLRLIYDTAYNPSREWTAYTITLRETAGWINAATHQPPTAAQMQRVLKNLTRLEIRGEYEDGPDVGSLDNVILGGSE